MLKRGLSPRVLHSSPSVRVCALRAMRFLLPVTDNACITLETNAQITFILFINLLP